MLRVYAAAHGLSSPRQAVVEVGADEILLRVDQRWTRFTCGHKVTSEGQQSVFTLNEDGSVKMEGVTAEMDMAAERVVRTMFSV